MLILFPHKLGQLKNGVQNTPFYFEKILKNNRVIVDCNNSYINKYKNMINNLRNLYLSNYKIQEKKINIGGDHSMSIATVADSLNKFHNNDLKVLWFDAHPDINTYESSETKNFHGMPLSYLTNLSNNSDFDFINNKLNFDNLMYIGIRDIDNHEKKIIDKNNIQYITCDEVNNNLNKSLDKINNFIGNNPIHLSFDVDCMDPEIIPCTGTRFGNGLNLINTKIILDKLVDFNIVNIDITEINLELGNQEEQEKTISNILHLFNKYLVY